MLDDLAAIAEAQWRETMRRVQRPGGSLGESFGVPGVPGGTARAAGRFENVPNIFLIFGDDARITVGDMVAPGSMVALEVAGLTQMLGWALRRLGAVDLTVEEATEIHTEIGEALDELARSSPNWDEVAPRLQGLKEVLKRVAGGISEVIRADAAEAAVDVLERLAPWFTG